MKQIGSPGSAAETLEAFVARIMAQTGAAPTVEFAVFSGSADDWRKDGSAVYLRLSCTMRLDGDAKPHEIWARLFAPGGFWRIPRKETEMLVLIPANLGDSPGAAWCCSTAQEPPEKLDQDHAYLDLDDETWLLMRVGGWALKAAGVTVGIEKGTGKFQISGAGCYFAFNPATPSFEFVIGNGATPNRVLAMLKLSPVGIEMVTANDAGTTKQLWTIGADGHTKTFATGQFTWGAKAGVMLGVSSGAVVPLAIWAGGVAAPSTHHGATG